MPEIKRVVTKGQTHAWTICNENTKICTVHLEMRQRVLRSTKCDKRLTINVSSNNPILVLSFSSSDWKFPSHGLCLQVNIDKQRSWPIVNELCWLFQFYCGRQNSKLNKHSYSTTCIYHQLRFRFDFFTFHFRFIFVSFSFRFLYVSAYLCGWIVCACSYIILSWYFTRLKWEKKQ